jgi:hypothetical protein
LRKLADAIFNSSRIENKSILTIDSHNWLTIWNDIFAVDLIVLPNFLQNLFFKAGLKLDLFDDANGAIVPVFRRER